MAQPDQSASRVALVTGAAGGIGRRIVHRLAEDGAAIVAVDRDAQALDALVSQSGRVTPVLADVTDAEQVERAVADAENTVGPIDYLVNAAGILKVGGIVDLSEEDWDQMFAVNSRSLFLVVRSVLARMIPRRHGSIVVVSSNAARTPRKSMSAYSASKAAASMLSRCAGLEGAEHGIRCNIVSPGSTDTNMLQESWEFENRSHMTIAGVPESFRLGIPLRRIADPDDIVDAVQFLLSDRARHITMQELTVDGGATLGA